MNTANEIRVDQSEVGRTIIEDIESLEETDSAPAEAETDQKIEISPAYEYVETSEILESVILQRREVAGKIAGFQGQNIPRELLAERNQLAGYFDYLKEKADGLYDQMRVDGWIFSQRGKDGFQVQIETGKKGNPVFRIVDAFGVTPVKVGEQFSAQLSDSNSIPSALRPIIVENFTYQGNAPKEIYDTIPNAE